MTLSELRALHARHLSTATAASERLDAAGMADEARSAAQAEFDGAMASADRVKGLIEAAGALPEAPATPAAPERDADPVEQRGAPAAAAAGRGARVEKEPSPYGLAGKRSFAGDVFAAIAEGDGEAHKRLVTAAGAEKRANAEHNTTVQGAYVVPASIMDAEDLRTDGTPTIDTIGPRELADGVSEMRWQAVTAGATAAEQAAEGDAFTKSSIGTGIYSKKPATIGVYSDVPFQLSDRSDPSFDQTLLADLRRSVIEATELKVLSADDTKFDGLLTTSRATTITYTDASPTAAKWLGQFATAVAKHVRANKRRPSHAFITPERWAWLLGAVDGAQRPLVVPDAGGRQNAAVLPSGDAVPVNGGLVGTIHGIPVVVNAYLPVNQGAGTNQDVVVFITKSDLRLHISSGMHLTIAREVLAHEGQVRFVLRHNALSAVRMPLAVTRISGTGLVLPS